VIERAQATIVWDARATMHIVVRIACASLTPVRIAHDRAAPVSE